MVNLNKEIVFASSESSLSREIGELERKGKLRKIAPRVYTTNVRDKAENIIRRNLMEILAWRFPLAIISHRSAQELHPTSTGDFFLTTTQNRRITDLPGITINLIKGKPALPSDIPYNGLFIAAESRWMLEIMQPTRKRGDESKTLPQEYVEKRLENMLLHGGEQRLNRFRDETRQVAEALDLLPEFQKLNKIISALLSTHTTDVLKTDSAKARGASEPYDATRLELFDILFEHLNNQYFTPFTDIQEENAFRTFAFFESYFSNYIEGTEFVVTEAKEIVDSGLPRPRRDEDSHDILGTYRIVSNRYEMSRIPHTKEEFFDILRQRHAILLAGRPTMNPGQFKQVNNRAGETLFVDSQLVCGTLAKGFLRYQALRDPFARAVFMMFLISEVHPFNDGNGRIARIMMNAEFVNKKQCRIIIPTVYRLDYLLSLRKLSRHKQPQTYVEVMQRMQYFSSQLYGVNFEEINAYLAKCHAYAEPEEEKLLMLNRKDIDKQ